MIGGSAAASLKILLNGDPTGAIRGMDAVERRALAMSEKLKGYGKALMGLGAGALTAFAFTSIKLGEQAGETLKQAKQIGAGAEEFQRLRYAIEQNEGSVESLVRGMLKLNQTAVAAVEGNQASVNIFKRLNVEYKNFDGSVRNTSDILMDLSNVMASSTVTDEEKANVLRLIGLRNKEMYQFLMLGRDGILAYTKAAKGVVSEETLKKMDDWADRWAGTKLVIQSFLMDAIVPLLPYLHKAADFIDRMVESFKALSPETKKSMGQMFLFGAAGLVAGGALIYLGGAIIGLGALFSPLSLGIIGVTVGLDAFYRAGGAVSAMIGDFVASLGYLIQLIPGLETFLNIYGRLWGGKGGFSATGMEEFGQRMSARGQTQYATGLVGEAKNLIGKMDLGIFGGTAAAGANAGAKPSLALAGTPSIFGGSMSMPLPSLRTVSQVGQNRTVYFQGNFDTTADGVEAMNDVVNDNF